MSQKNFERKMNRLEEIVETINTGELALEDALARFEEGVGLIRELSAELNEARGKITKFVEMLNQEVPLDVPDNS
ncbi:MAG: exodeoxyribonuclease VII small subunit [Acidobacteria bacterium]|nr:exodeoxyribonuclease VII small subunit [Acidobacteriota bacterium]